MYDSLRRHLIDSLKGKSGATTVASTMILARAAGIPVFVTGGIGGVHRGAEKCKHDKVFISHGLLTRVIHTAMDISADLMELGRTPVAVVCAGVKSILDIEKTLEVLVILLLLTIIISVSLIPIS